MLVARVLRKSVEAAQTHIFLELYLAGFTACSSKSMATYEAELALIKKSKMPSNGYALSIFSIPKEISTQSPAENCL